MSRALITREAKIDAYNMAISYLQTEECAYDDDAPFRAGRLWLAGRLQKELDKRYPITRKP
jgi:hypothetical protein